MDKKAYVLSALLATSFFVSGCSQKTFDSAKGDLDKLYKQTKDRVASFSNNSPATNSNDANNFPGLNPDQNKVYAPDQATFMIILDASGSMNESDSNGNTKLGSAKKTISDIVGQLDNTRTNVGLMAFNDGCNSTKLLIEPNNKDLTLVTQVVNGINASGTTPLAASLKKAGEILNHADKKVRLLVISDGGETCGGNPVEEAKKLMVSYNIEPTIYVVGYNVDSNTKIQLESVAKVGKGTYSDVKDSVSLSQTINNIIAKENIKKDNFSKDGSVYKVKINFKNDLDVVNTQYFEDLKQLAIYLINNKYKAEIQGHTDSVGSKDYNEKLSLQRAKAVLEVLVGMGVDRNKLSVKGFGGSIPIASNKTEEGRFQNRRVEAHIDKN
jgi:outer membrane protein OmpA-like peptidoglycan-associated protein